MAIHQTANYTGVVISGFLAAWIGERWGWRASFYTFGLAGIVLAVLIGWRLKAHAPVDVPKPDATAAIPLREVIRVLLRRPTVLLLAIAFGGMIFVHIGYLTWTPTYLQERFGLSLSNAGFSSVFYHHVFAYAGVLLGGWMSDRIAVRRARIRMEIEAAALLLGAPFLFMLGTANSLLATYVALAGFGFFRGLYDSNLMAAPFDLVPVKYRSSASGLILAFGFVIGAAAPISLGWIKLHFGLRAGLASLGAVYLFSALIIAVALKYFYPRDYQATQSLT